MAQLNNDDDDDDDYDINDTPVTVVIRTLKGAIEVSVLSVSCYENQ